MIFKQNSHIRSLRLFLLLPLLASYLLLNACEGGQKQQNGALLGGIAGGVIGSDFGKGNGRLVTTGVGVLLGTLAGSSVGKSMDELDRLKAKQATQNSLEYLPDGQTSSWQNPNTSHEGTVTPTQTYYQKGRPCRHFKQQITIDNQTQYASGVACRRHDGTWQIVKENN